MMIGALSLPNTRRSEPTAWPTFRNLLTRTPMTAHLSNFSLPLSNKHTILRPLKTAVRRPFPPAPGKQEALIEQVIPDEWRLGTKRGLTAKPSSMLWLRYSSATTGKKHAAWRRHASASERVGANTNACSGSSSRIGRSSGNRHSLSLFQRQREGS